jgi:MFS family permease
MAGVFMIVLDFFIVNVALPSMQSHLHASTSALEWVVAGYGLAFFNHAHHRRPPG